MLQRYMPSLFDKEISLFDKEISSGKRHQPLASFRRLKRDHKYITS